MGCLILKLISWSYTIIKITNKKNVSVKIFKDQDICVPNVSSYIYKILAQVPGVARERKKF